MSVGVDPPCPRCGGDRLRRETRRIASRISGIYYATGGWYVCLDCVCCFDGVTDHDNGLLPYWVEKRQARRRRASWRNWRRRRRQNERVLWDTVTAGNNNSPGYIRGTLRLRDYLWYAIR